jgi:tetratricopeptide (TPR) repeat protein
MRSVYLAFFGVIAFAAPARAQATDNWSVCTGRMPNAAMIDACTAIINSGQETGTRLGQAYFGRGFEESIQMSYAPDKNAMTAQAIADLSQSIALDPTNPDAFGIRGMLYYEQQNFAAALPDYETSDRLRPDGTSGFDVAHAYEHVGQIEKAGALYNALIKKNPKDDSVYEDRGKFYLRNNQARLAVADFSMVLKLTRKKYFDGSDADIIYLRGLAKRASGDEKGAAADIAKASSLYPGMTAPTLDY